MNSFLKVLRALLPSMAGAAIILLLAYIVILSYAQERPRPGVIPKPGAEQPADQGHGPAPKDESLFVWPIPEQGTQSLVVLRVIDGETVEAGLLVPVIVKLKGVTAPQADTPEGKKAAEALDKMVGGRLLPANLHGREKFGRLVGSFWLGEKEGGWLSDALIKQGAAKPEK